ncbi:family 10 glycosylhydrolase [Psychrobacillus sp. BL-248-WT-3]|uniref:glycoside hydrolase family 10 protein n=1 Tax=Psychrobacillus sp. BL-248-WT-3 TaxID=2725306 RepID=UPI00146CD0B1|nr:family 10 glycosylhydrolase [Psychrobacillus sp. BL-248-WT-3]NME06129.1 family 10 glycosylhydrolase [Psychrobacillus sp. BL-248-WT-3]
MNRRYFKAFIAVLLTFTLFFTSIETGSAVSTISPKVEMRASWISTVANIDLKPGMDEAAYTSWARSTIKELERKNFNTVVFQVKPTADALYPSELAPWSRYITGSKQGTNPGYDPLQIMLDTAHEHGMELHAWINPYRVTMANQKLEELAPNNIASIHPEWVVKHGTQYYLNPGIPGVQSYLIDAVKELVTNYDVDAVHMDDYFYPGVNFDDAATYAQYGADFNDIGDWRRNNVNELVQHINSNIKQIKPWVQFGISPSGIWRNSKDDPNGSETNGSAHYDSLFADSRKWIQSGYIDYITPQVYWSRQLAIANYSVLLEWWSRQTEGYPINLYIGMADYKVNANFDTAWDNPYELPEQILDNRTNGKTMGQMHFTLRDILANKLGYADIVENEIYQSKSLTPPTPWNGAEEPKKPILVTAKNNGNSVQISIDNKKRKDARKYVIYRFEGNQAGDYNDPKNIVGVVFDQNGFAKFQDQNVDPNKRYTYGVTSISYTGVESKNAEETKTKK